jgi:hypothetical protein
MSSDSTGRPVDSGFAMRPVSRTLAAAEPIPLECFPDSLHSLMVFVLHFEPGLRPARASAVERCLGKSS